MGSVIGSSRPLLTARRVSNLTADGRPSMIVVSLRAPLERYTGARNIVWMKNLTIALDEATLRDARRIASERSTSLNGLIRDYLDRLTKA